MNYIDKLKAIEAKTKLTDQTPIPLGGVYGSPEMRQVRNMLIAKDSEIENLKAKINNARVKVEEARVALG